MKDERNRRRIKESVVSVFKIIKNKVISRMKEGSE